MPIEEAAVWEALKTVEEPELHRDLVSLDMIKDLKISDSGEVSLRVVLTTPACPMKGVIETEVKRAVIRVPGVKKVTVELGSNVVPSNVQQLGQDIRNIIGIASGKGGVGKSTVSVNIAVALAKTGARVGLLDADVYGPNLPIMMGLRNEAPTAVKRKDPSGEEIDVILPLEKYGVKVMSMGFLIEEDQPVIWRGPMLNSVLRQFMSQVDWGELDYLIVDLPPGTGDVQISLIQLVHVAGVLHVTTPQEVALQDVRKGMAMFKSQNIPLLGLVENMSYFVCPHCNERSEIFGHGGGEQLEASAEIPLLARIPLAPEIREAGDNGIPVVIANPESPQARELTAAAEKLAALISVRNAGQQAAH